MEYGLTEQEKEKRGIGGRLLQSLAQAKEESSIYIRQLNASSSSSKWEPYLLYLMQITHLSPKEGPCFLKTQRLNVSFYTDINCLIWLIKKVPEFWGSESLTC